MHRAPAKPPSWKDPPAEGYPPEETAIPFALTLKGAKNIIHLPTPG